MELVSLKLTAWSCWICQHHLHFSHLQQYLKIKSLVDSFPGGTATQIPELKDGIASMLKQIEPKLRMWGWLPRVCATAGSVPLPEELFSWCFCYLLLVRNEDIVINILNRFL